jgi:hypothetical protein
MDLKWLILRVFIVNEKTLVFAHYNVSRSGDTAAYFASNWILMKLQGIDSLNSSAKVSFAPFARLQNLLKFSKQKPYHCISQISTSKSVLFPAGKIQV